LPVFLVPLGINPKLSSIEAIAISVPIPTSAPLTVEPTLPPTQLPKTPPPNDATIELCFALD